jgi:hypothetical protein
MDQAYKKSLQEFFYDRQGDLDVTKHSPFYKQLDDKFYKYLYEIKELLPEEHKGLIMELESTVGGRESEAINTHYQQGFSDAFKLIMSMTGNEKGIA